MDDGVSLEYEELFEGAEGWGFKAEILKSGLYVNILQETVS